MNSVRLTPPRRPEGQKANEFRRMKDYAQRNSRGSSRESRGRENRGLLRFENPEHQGQEKPLARFLLFFLSFFLSPFSREAEGLRRRYSLDRRMIDMHIGSRVFPLDNRGLRIWITVERNFPKRSRARRVGPGLQLRDIIKETRR